MTARLLPVLAGLGLATLMALGVHAALSGDHAAAGITVTAPPAAPSGAPGALSGGIPAPLPTVAPLPDPIPGLWGDLNRDTAAYVRGEMSMLNELETVIARQITHLLAHPAGR